MSVYVCFVCVHVCVCVFKHVRTRYVQSMLPHDHPISDPPRSDRSPLLIESQNAFAVPAVVDDGIREHAPISVASNAPSSVASNVSSDTLGPRPAAQRSCDVIVIDNDDDHMHAAGAAADDDGDEDDDDGDCMRALPSPSAAPPLPPPPPPLPAAFAVPSGLSSGPNSLMGATVSVSAVSARPVASSAPAVSDLRSDDAPSPVFFEMSG